MKDKKSPEYIAVSLMFYSFIVAMIVFAVFRFCGIAWFSPEYVSYSISEPLYYIITSVLHILEGYIIMRVLTNESFIKCILIAFIYDLLTYLIMLLPFNNEILFVFDIIYIVSIPFIFNQNKDMSIINSCVFILFIALYQVIMSFSRYAMIYTAKYDVIYSLLSLIDYKCFLIVLLLFVKMKRIKGDKSNE